MDEDEDEDEDKEEDSTGRIEQQHVQCPIHENPKEGQRSVPKKRPRASSSVGDDIVERNKSVAMGLFSLDAGAHKCRQSAAAKPSLGEGKANTKKRAKSNQTTREEASQQSRASGVSTSDKPRGGEGGTARRRKASEVQTAVDFDSAISYRRKSSASAESRINSSIHNDNGGHSHHADHHDAASSVIMDNGRDGKIYLDIGPEECTPAVLLSASKSDAPPPQLRNFPGTMDAPGAVVLPIATAEDAKERELMVPLSKTASDGATRRRSQAAKTIRKIILGTMARRRRRRMSVGDALERRRAPAEDGIYVECHDARRLGMGKKARDEAEGEQGEKRGGEADTVGGERGCVWAERPLHHRTDFVGSEVRRVQDLT